MGLIFRKLFDFFAFYSAFAFHLNYYFVCFVSLCLLIYLICKCEGSFVYWFPFCIFFFWNHKKCWIFVDNFVLVFWLLFFGLYFWIFEFCYFIVSFLCIVESCIIIACFAGCCYWSDIAVVVACYGCYCCCCFCCYGLFAVVIVVVVVAVVGYTHCVYVEDNCLVIFFWFWPCLSCGSNCSRNLRMKTTIIWNIRVSYGMCENRSSRSRNLTKTEVD